MRLPALLAACTVAALSLAAARGPSAAASAPPEHHFNPLKGIECLDPDFARSFVPIGDRSLLVDAGHYRYRIDVNGSCWALDTTPIIGFRGDPITHRVCGSPMDAVLVRGGHPCQVANMTLLSKDEYKAALHEREDWLQDRRERKARKQK